MATLIPRVPTNNNQQYTLDTQAAAGANTLTLNQSVSGVIRAPGYCVVDRIDSSGNKTATKREYKKYTGVSGAQLTGVTNFDGTDQVHAVGAIVEFVPDVGYENDWYTAVTTEHDTYGVHVTLPSLSLVNTPALSVASTASIRNIVAFSYNASGASLQGFPVRPVWFVSGNVSAATTSLGRPTPMPEAATVQWVSMAVRAPVSSASLVIDLNKNFTTMFTDQNTRLSILGGGTFASTASIAVKNFNAGDVLSVDIDAGGNYSDLTVVVNAR